MSQARRRRRPVSIAAVLAVCLLVSACGARWDDDQRAAVEARAAGVSTGGDATSGDGATDGSLGVTDGSTGTTIAGTSTDGGTTGGTGGTTGGTGGTAGGTGGTGGAAAAGARPCAAASKAPGVSDTEITLGTISSLSGPVPGLGQSALDAARAYVAYRNATGGVCGRKLSLKTADDGTDGGRHRAAVQDFNGKVLGLVGGLGGGDSGSGQTVANLGMPAVATAISEQFQDSKTVFDINPPFANVHAVIAKYKYLYSQGIRTAAIVYLGIDQTRSEILDKQRPQMEAAGIKIVNQQELPLSTLSYDSAARGVANSKADYLLFLADYTQSASMARAMTDTGYKLKSAEYVTAYGSGFLDLAGKGAENAVSWIRNLPNEEPGSNAEQKAFLQWMGRIAPNTAADTFAADSWAAAKAMVDALEALPGPISRPAVIAQLKTMNAYDAGGFIGKIQLGKKLNNGCFIAMKVVGGKWKRIAPASGFLC